MRRHDTLVPQQGKRRSEVDEELKTRAWYLEFLDFTFSPVTVRYVCRPIIHPWAFLIGFFIFTLCTMSVAIIVNNMRDKVIECEVEYPSMRYNIDNPKYEEQLKLDKVKYVWVTFGEIICEVEKDCYREDWVMIGPDTCGGEHTELEGDIYVSYKLEPFYQNHRQYIFSIDRLQIDGSFRSAAEAWQCAPLVTLSDYMEIYGGPRYGWPDISTVSSNRAEVVLHPCGLQALSVFNDTFELHHYDYMAETVGDQIPLVTTDISVDADNFRNPNASDIPLDGEGKALVYEWLPPHIFPNKIENEHLRNWMRLSPYPEVKKLWANVELKKINVPLIVKVKNRYDVSMFDGKKSIVVATYGRFGYINEGTFYCLLAIVLVVFLLLIIFMAKLRLKPRLMGDIRLLHSRN